MSFISEPPLVEFMIVCFVAASMSRQTLMPLRRSC